MLTFNYLWIILNLQSRTNATKGKECIMVDVSKLKGKIIEKNTTQEVLAHSIGMNRSTFYRKMKQGGNFSIDEVNRIVTTLHLSKEDAVSIFFGDFVA